MQEAPPAPRVTIIPAVDPVQVRADAGFSARATWYSPRKQRPYSLKVLQGTPGNDVREDD